MFCSMLQLSNYKESALTCFLLLHFSLSFVRPCKHCKSLKTFLKLLSVCMEKIGGGVFSTDCCNVLKWDWNKENIAIFSCQPCLVFFPYRSHISRPSQCARHRWDSSVVPCFDSWAKRSRHGRLHDRGETHEKWKFFFALLEGYARLAGYALLARYALRAGYAFPWYEKQTEPGRMKKRILLSMLGCAAVNCRV